jgi:colanic acid/amylovoran biosynthesis glycosyltransferase
LLAGDIFYYYDGELPAKLEGGIVINSRKRRLLDLIKGHYRLNRFSLAEQALITSFKKKKIDLVFAEYGTSGVRLLPVCKELGIPLIAHFHGFDASRKRLLEEHEGYKKLFEYATFIVVVSKKMQEDFLKLGCPSEKLIYNPYGPSNDFFEVSPTFSRPRFIAVGRFVDKKAPYYIILAFREVLKKYPEAQLIMAGQGKLRESCKNLVSYFKLEKNIHLPGIIQPEEFRDHLKDSLAFIQHSVTAENGDTEGTPVAILEAAAAGIPVIATRHAGIPDVVREGESGILVDEHDVKKMAEAMMQLIADPRRAKIMGSKAREIVSSQFTMQRHIELLNDLINKAL